jgi:hypothetical protein
LDGSTALDIFNNIKSYIQILSTVNAGVEYLTYHGEVLGINIPAGIYYVQLQKGNSIYYSETFKVDNDVNSMLKLVWYNNGDIAPVMYQNAFQNLLYIEDAYTEAIVPEVQQDVEKDNQGNSIVMFQRVVQKYKFETLLPDYLLDALTLMQIHSDIYLTENNETVQCVQIKVTPTYSDNYLGKAVVEFQVSDASWRTNVPENIT